MARLGWCLALLLGLRPRALAWASKRARWAAVSGAEAVVEDLSGWNGDCCFRKVLLDDENDDGDDDDEARSAVIATSLACWFALFSSSKED